MEEEKKEVRSLSIEKPLTEEVRKISMKYTYSATVPEKMSYVTISLLPVVKALRAQLFPQTEVMNALSERKVAFVFAISQIWAQLLATATFGDAKEEFVSVVPRYPNVVHPLVNEIVDLCSLPPSRCYIKHLARTLFCVTNLVKDLQPWFSNGQHTWQTDLIYLDRLIGEWPEHDALPSGKQTAPAAQWDNIKSFKDNSALAAKVILECGTCYYLLDSFSKQMFKATLS